MNIGIVAKQPGVPAKTIRYYESIGLIPPAGRKMSGYRDYDAKDVKTLCFIHHARGLGFPVKDVAAIMALWQNADRASADVKALALDHIRDVERRITALQAIRHTLIDLTERCHGDDRPDCPILENLADSMASDGAGSVDQGHRLG